jgi:hypothetical protein
MEIRWQIMRGYESAVQVDCENIALRRTIENLQIKSLSTNAKHDETLKAFKSKFAKLVKVARESLVDTRQYSDAQMSSIASQITAVRRHVRNLGEMGLNTEGDLAGTIKVKLELEKEIERLKANIVEISAGRKSENERASAQISQLRVELGEADARHVADSTALSEIRMETDSLANTNQKLLDEIKTLRMWAQKMEMDGLQTVAEAREQRQRMKDHHDGVVASLLAESTQLRTRIGDLEAEVSRLQAVLAQPVQETHFQKFVNLKQANVQLKSKLQQLVKEQRHDEANGLVGAGARPPLGPGNGSQKPGARKQQEKKEPAQMSLQQQVYLASLERERAEAEEIREQQEYLQLYGSHQEVPPMPALVGAIPIHLPTTVQPGFGFGNRGRAPSPMNDEDILLSPRSNMSSAIATASYKVRPVNSAGLQIGVPLMGKQTRDSLSQRVEKSVHV